MSRRYFKTITNQELKVFVLVNEPYEEALSDVNSAIRCYIEVFGTEMLEDDPPVNNYY